MSQYFLECDALLSFIIMMHGSEVHGNSKNFEMKDTCNDKMLDINSLSDIISFDFITSSINRRGPNTQG